MKGDQTRSQFVETAARLFQAHGFHGVGLAQLIKESGAPKGSFYYHFPGGKEELALAAIAHSDQDVRSLLDHAAATANAPDRYILAICRGLKGWLSQSDFSAGCPVAGLTLELAAGSPSIAAACRSAYAGWTGEIASALAAFGVPRSTADDLALAIIGGFEGAVIISRATRSAKPLDQMSRVLVASLGSGA